VTWRRSRTATSTAADASDRRDSRAFARAAERTREEVTHGTRHNSDRAIHDELNALTDRELADLDLSRLGLRDIAGEAVYCR
jgi:hypothetical protein